MNKRISLIISIIYSSCLFSQTTELIIPDTSKIKWYLSSDDKDTVFRLIDYNFIGKCIVYYDVAKRQKAFELETEKGTSFRSKLLNGQIWFRDGKIKQIQTINSGKDTLSTINYYRSGKIKSTEMVVWGSTYGTWVLIKNDNFYENGQRKRTPIDWTSQNKQHIITYFETGAKEEEFNWVNGTLVGEYKKYFKNGRIQTIGMYLNSSDLDPNAPPMERPSMEIGTWKYYNEVGELIKEVQYDNGKIIKKTEK